MRMIAAVALSLSAAHLAVPVVAAAEEDNATKEQTPAYSTQTTDIGTLIDTPATRAVLDRHMPGFADNPQIAMARSMTMRQIQSFAADMMSDEVLAKIDADLAAIKK